MKRYRWIVSLFILLLTLCSCLKVEEAVPGSQGSGSLFEESAVLSEGNSPPDGSDIDHSHYANVREFGAAGDASYHHPMGVRGGETDRSQYVGWYWAGHFSRLVTAEYCEKYRGRAGEGFSDVYKVVPDSSECAENQIRLSEVNPGPFYEPAVGDVVVRYEAADEEKSVYATDDSDSFERAIAAGGGRLYIPEGDYLVSQLTAAKIKEIAGPGRIWLKEWRGGILWYLILGQSDLVEYQNYGWIDQAHFHDPVWRAMHWITDLPEANGWKSSADFQNNTDSPCMEYRFDDTRENINVWLTIAPAAPKEDFPDEITLCISKDMAAYYTLGGSTEWKRATSGGVEGGMYHSSWNGKSRGLGETAWVDCGRWVEVAIPKEAFFSPLEGSDSEIWYFHCWSAENASLTGQPVEFTKSCATVWVKDAAMSRYLTCAIGGDMRSPYWDRPTTEYYIHEAYYGASLYLTGEPRTFYAYNVSDARFDDYFAADEKNVQNDRICEK